MGVVRRLSAGRVGLLAAGLAAIAVVASLVVFLGGQQDGRPNAEKSSAVDCDERIAATVETAARAAGECGVDIEVLDERTPWATSWVMPEGTSRLEIASVPSRTEVDGDWVDVDRTLVEDESTGVLEVAAPVYSIELSAGDAGVSERRPLGVIEREDERLEVWFPLELPEPEVSGPRATYSLDDGVRLVVTVNSDTTGFSPVVVLDSPAAAARFKASLSAARAVSGDPGSGPAVAYRTVTSEGLRVVADATGAVSVVNADGVEFFSAPPSMMWDSSSTLDESGTHEAESDMATPDPLTGQGPGTDTVTRLHSDGFRSGDRVVSQKVEVVADSIVVTPDEAMLSAPETVWPVYVDPSFGAIGAAERILVRTGGYTSSIYGWTAEIDGGNGRCTDSTCNRVFTARLSWEFRGLDMIKNMTGADVVSATFRVNGVHSYNCNAATTDLYLTNSISTSTTWATLGAGTVLDSITGSQRSTCGTAGWKALDATVGVKRLADNDWVSVTMGLKSRDESTMAGWKRFAYNATLEAVYNRPPKKPTSVQLSDPIELCASGADRPLIASYTPQLSAKVEDPDGQTVRAHFQVLDLTTGAEVWNSGTMNAQASGTYFKARVASGKLVNGKSYQYRVTAVDTDPVLAKWSGWSTAVCEFKVDTSAPARPTIKPILTGYSAVYETGFERGGKGITGGFQITGATDVDHYLWDTVSPPRNDQSHTLPGGTSAILRYTPDSPGLKTLYVWAVDSAGNHSEAKYSFAVASPKEDAVWSFDDATQGETAADTAGIGTAKTLTFEGDARWTTGPHELFSARDNDGALNLQGAGDYAETIGPVLDTRESFAISAFVKLDAAAVDQGKFYTALSQDGVVQAGFRLQYEPSCVETGGAAGKGCWRFTMADADKTDSPAARVRSKVEVRGGEWVHLVAEHDKVESKLRLWVCPVGTPQHPEPGIPVKAETTRSATLWQASGSFAVGRGLYNGASIDWWPGDIDNVRVFSDEVVAESKIRRMCQGAEATDLAAGNKGIDPTEKEPTQ